MVVGGDMDERINIQYDILAVVVGGRPCLGVNHARVHISTLAISM